MVEWFREKAKRPYGKDIVVDTKAFTTPIRQDKVLFFGGLALVTLVLVVFYHKYLFTRYSIGILVMLFFSLSKSGLSRAIIKNDVTGNFGMITYQLQLLKSVFRHGVWRQTYQVVLFYHSRC